jgi:hypothetical protein
VPVTASRRTALRHISATIASHSRTSPQSCAPDDVATASAGCLQREQSHRKPLQPGHHAPAAQRVH